MRIRLFALLVLLLMLAAPAAAQDDINQAEGLGARCADVPYGNFKPEVGAEQTFVHPPNPDGPTVVNIGLYVIEITAIDVNTNDYRMEGFLDLIWCDPRVSFDPEETGVQREIFLEHEAQEWLAGHWNPDIEFVNESGGREIENEEILIGVDGTVEYRERFSVHLATEYNLTRFPFDQQTLVAEIESFAWSSEMLRFHVEEGVIDFSDEFHIPEWRIVGLEEHITSRQEIRDRAPFDELVVEITVTRDPGYYLSKVIAPLGVIVAISWIALWLPVDATGDRIGLAFTGVLTSVAYQFIIADSLPRHVYNTFIDSFVIWSFLAMVLGIVETVTVYMMVNADRRPRAEVLDRTMRWLLPVGYVLGAVALGIVYMML